MYEVGNLQKYLIDETGTSLLIHIPQKNLQEEIIQKRIKTCELRINDGRTISAEQRKKAHATIGDIAQFTGDYPGWMKEWLKNEFMARTGIPKFSLSDCSMDIAREFISFILEFAIENGIPLSDLAINRTDDIGKYLYACLLHKKCAICGRSGEIHHWDAIGMGKDRKKYDDSSHRKICLCRNHHTECHQIGRDIFEKRYKVYGIIFKVTINNV